MISASVRSSCSSACSRVSLPEATRPSSWPAVSCARLLQADVDEALFDVAQHDRDPRGGDQLGDLAAHRSGADDAGLENEHRNSSRLGVSES